MKKSYLFIFLLIAVIGLSFFGFINLSRAEKEIDPTELLNKAKDLYYQGDLKAAKELYLSLGDNLTALKNSYFLAKELGEWKQVETILARLQEALPGDYYWTYKQAVNFYRLGELEKAQQNFLALLEAEAELSPRLISLSCYFLGNIYRSLGDYKTAREFLQKGIELSPQLVINFLSLAELSEAEGDLEQAIQLYRKLLQYDSSYTYVYPRLALLYEELAEPQAAYYYWNRSLATNIEQELARSQINELVKKYPEIIVQEKTEKSEARKNIDFLQVEPVVDETIPLVRVGLVNEGNELSFQAGADFTIFSGEQIILKGLKKTEWQIKYQQGSFAFYQEGEKVKEFSTDQSLVISLDDKSRTIVLYDIKYGQGYFWAGTQDQQYRGEIELNPVSASSFQVINIINLEEYLFSVVPAEMPAWWPKEALKAQAVAARSYALKNMERHSSDGYNFCATVHCAAYRGASAETAKTNQIVLDTRGEIAVFGGQIIDAVFSSNSGGYSESSYDVWGNEHAYLSGANNMLLDLDFPLEPFQIEDWLMDEPPSYASNPRYAGFNKYRWLKILPAEYLLKRYGLEEIKQIIPLGRSKGGSIKKIIIQGKNKEVVLQKDQIRSGLGGLRSNRFVIEPIFKDGLLQEFIIYGSGWGHNVGMDQTAAAGMAAENFSYQEILKHFYQGIAIEKAY